MVGKRECLEVQCNGIASNHCYDTRNGSRSLAEKLSPVTNSKNNIWEEEIPCTNKRSRCSSACSDLSSQLSPTGSDSNHCLRSRSQMWIPNNLVGTIAEDKASNGRSSDSPKEEHRENGRLRSGGKLLCHGRSKTVKKKRLSVEEKLLEDNKSYYKMEVKPVKLRSSGYFISQREAELRREEEIKKQDSKCNGEAEIKQEKQVLKIRKIRKTELSVLSDEAEMFMFGEAQKPEPVENIEEEKMEEEIHKRKVGVVLKKEKVTNGNKDRIAITCSVLGDEDKSTIKSKNKSDTSEENSMCSVGSCSASSSIDASDMNLKKKKRKTQAEAFIHDNLDYYKFEIPTSRLRYQGNFSKGSDDEAERENESNNQRPLDEIKLEEDVMVKEEKIEEEGESLNKLVFSFESVPISDAWYQTYQRQDQCEEFYYGFCHDYIKPFLLPYEMPLETFLLPSSSSNSSISSKPKKKRIGAAIEKKPRKSPRCHASTLAILSSLMHHRKRKEPDKEDSSQRDEIPEQAIEESSSTLLGGEQSSVEMKHQTNDINEIAQSMENMMQSVIAEDDCKKPGRGRKPSVETKVLREVDPCVLDEMKNGRQIALQCSSFDVISILDEYSTCRCKRDGFTMRCFESSFIADSCNSSEYASSTCDEYGRVRGRRRKRKKNLTGWPLEKKGLRRKIIKNLEKKHNQTETVPTDVKEDVKVVSNSFPIESEDSSDISQNSQIERRASFEFQPCVRVTRMPDFYGSCTLNQRRIINRRLRSSSSSSLSSPYRRRNSYPTSSKHAGELIKRLRRTGSKWDTWSVKKQR